MLKQVAHWQEDEMEQTDDPPQLTLKMDFNLTNHSGILLAPSHLTTSRSTSKKFLLRKDCKLHGMSFAEPERAGNINITRLFNYRIIFLLFCPSKLFYSIVFITNVHLF